MAGAFLNNVGGGGWLGAALGGRECTSGFFNQDAGSLDVSTVCHDVRGLDLKEGEQAYVSVRDLRRREGEAFAQLGMVCNLRTLELDTTLLLRVWVDEVSSTAGKPNGQRRVVGEVRIPLRRLIQIYNACMYHTWINLETPGLHDSVASLGLMGSDDGANFDQAIQDGPRQLSQPKACISVCRSADIGPNGKILWTADVPPEARTAWWAPLLRSQQQHVMLSAGLFMKCDRQAAQVDSSSASADSSQQATELQERNLAQAEEISRLRAQLESSRSQLSQQQSAPQSGYPFSTGQDNNIFKTNPDLSGIPSRQGHDSLPTEQMQRQVDDNIHRMGGLSITQGQRGPAPYGQDSQASQSRRLAEADARAEEAEARESKTNERLKAALIEAEHSREECDRLRVEHQTVQSELEKISAEANGKIEAANDRIRMLRSQREKVEADLQQINSSTIPMLTEEKSTLENENRQLAEQKEALLRIVEDLHQTCIAAGLNTAGRQSIDNMTCSITRDFQLT